jgi:hypothetical protein
MRVTRNRTAFHHPQIEDTFRLPVRIVETFARTSYGFEMAVKRMKEQEQEALENDPKYQRPAILQSPSRDFPRYKEMDVDEDVESEVAA